MSMRICFWNTARRTNAELVAHLCHSHEVDVMVLAECSAPVHSLLRALNNGHESLYYADSSPGLTSKLTILSRLMPNQVRPVRDTGDMAVRELRPPVGHALLLIALHLPSKLYYSDDDLAMLCPGFAQIIRESELQVGHQHTVVIGDFNMNPFEPGMIGATGFHAVMDRRVVSRGVRRVRGDDYHYFYNPMWSKLGDLGREPPGTYLHDAGKPVTLYWHAFDQLLVRPALAEAMQHEDVSIITSIGPQALASSRTERPDHTVSDHFPLLATIAVREEADHDR
jgi:endonuclease/exonuclease/phosphatase family protein